MGQKFATLSEAEKAICRRFKKARLEAGVTQPRIARHIGLSRDQVASVEAERVALRFWPAWRFCIELDINALWLAHGDAEGQPRPFANYAKGWAVVDETFAGDGEVTFAEAFRVIEPVYRHLYKPPRTVGLPLARHEDGLARLITAWLKGISPDNRGAFLAHLIRAAEQFKPSPPTTAKSRERAYEFTPADIENHITAVQRRVDAWPAQQKAMTRRVKRAARKARKPGKRKAPRRPAKIAA